MMPAARVGDMHVCPMVTAVVPHGNDDGFVHAATIVEEVQRRTEPVAPPSATKRNCDRERLSVSTGTVVLLSRGYL